MADRTDTFYAAEDAIQGYGGQLLKGNGASPEEFEAVAGVESINFGQMRTEDIRRTHLRSPDAHHEHAPGMRDSGEITAVLIWLPREQSQAFTGGGTGAFAGGGLSADWEARTIHNWKIRANNGSPATEIDVRGYVSQFQPTSFNATEIAKANVGIQPTQSYRLP